jgi:hypothetical protein
MMGGDFRLILEFPDLSGMRSREQVRYFIEQEPEAAENEE